MSKQLQTSTGGVLRDEHRVKDENGNWVTAVRLEAARTNSILHSEDFSDAAWNEIGSGVVTTDDVEAPDGTVTADKLTDDDTGTAEGVAQSIGVADDSLSRTFSVFIRKGGSTQVVIVLRYLGGTTVIPRVEFDATTGTFGAETSTTFERKIVEDYNADWWRVAVTASNNNSGNTTLQPRLFPASDTSRGSGYTGSAHFWGAQLEGLSGGASFPSSYIATTSSAVSRAADDLSFPISFGPQELTVYTKFVERGTVLGSDNEGLFNVGSIGDTATPPHINVFTKSGAGAYRIATNTDADQQFADFPNAVSVGDTVEILMTVESDWVAEGHRSINGGSTTSIGPTSANPPGASWGEDAVNIGRIQGSNRRGFNDFISLIIAPGVRTMDEMRRLAGN